MWLPLEDEVTKKYVLNLLEDKFLHDVDSNDELIDEIVDHLESIKKQGTTEEELSTIKYHLNECYIHRGDNIIFKVANEANENKSRYDLWSMSSENCNGYKYDLDNMMIMDIYVICYYLITGRSTPMDHLKDADIIQNKFEQIILNTIRRKQALR